MGKKKDKKDKKKAKGDKHHNNVVHIHNIITVGKSTERRGNPMSKKQHKIERPVEKSSYSINPPPLQWTLPQKMPLFKMQPDTIAQWPPIKKEEEQIKKEVEAVIESKEPIIKKEIENIFEGTPLKSEIDAILNNITPYTAIKTPVERPIHDTLNLRFKTLEDDTPMSTFSTESERHNRPFNMTNPMMLSGIKGNPPMRPVMQANLEFEDDEEDEDEEKDKERREDQFLKDIVKKTANTIYNNYNVIDIKKIYHEIFPDHKGTSKKNMILDLQKHLKNT